MPRTTRTFTAAEIADARYRYEDTNERVISIAQRLGIGERTLQRYIANGKWRPRLPKAEPPPIAIDQSEQSVTPPPIAPAPDIAQVAHSIQAIVEQEVATVAAIVAKLPRSTNSVEADRIARTLATLTRTLQEALRLRAPESSEDNADGGRGPDDPDEFIHEVARRLEEFARRAEGRGDPGDAATDAGAPGETLGW